MADSLFDLSDYRQFLAAAIRRRGVHQRDLARALDRVPSVISNVLSGLRSLDPELVQPIARFLALDAEEAAYFEALVDIHGSSPRARRHAWATVQATQRQRVAAGLTDAIAQAARRWYFTPIMELAACEGFRADPAWIAGTLVPPITVEEAQEALTTGVAVGALVPDEERGLVPATDVMWSPSDVVAPGQAHALVDVHRAQMELAAGCVERSRSNERHLSTLVLSVSEEQLARIRARLREFERELVLMATDPGEERNRVYQLGFQLFPVSLFTDSTADHSMWARSQGAPVDIEPDTTE